MIGPGGGAPQRSDDRTPPMNSQLALRVTIVGSLALLMFAVIFLRLWFLQVLTGHNYVAQAKSNITRPVSIPATRGEILADDGKAILVDSVKVPAILIQSQSLPKPLTADPKGLINQPAADQAVYTRLEQVLGMKTAPSKCTFTITYQNESGKLIQDAKYSPELSEIPCIIAKHNEDITSPGTVTVATDVPTGEQAYISEHQANFPGVQVAQTATSVYPQGTLAAQTLGLIGANSNPTTGGKLFKDVAAYDQVGTSGLEAQYNKYLQGVDGHERVEVNAQGTYIKTESPVPGQAGYDLKTWINLPLEKVGDAALAESLERAGSIYGGAFVAMDPQNGRVYAMGSLPSYNPEVFDKPVTPQQYTAEFGNSVTAPLFNRATQGVGPAGSTFKVITGLAALESGVWSPDQTYDDSGGRLTVSGEQFSNAPGDGAGGVLTIPTALEVSDDVFFYHLGEVMNPNPTTQPQGGAMQTWARKFGINQRPDIDLPNASAGTIPTPALTMQEIKEEHECETASGEYSYTDGINVSSKPHGKHWHRSPKHPLGCGIADPTTLGWTVGDNMHAAIGQGDVQASPLEMAMVYSAIENGGTLVTPHLGEDIQTASGQIVQPIDPKPERKLNISSANLQTIQRGLELAANGPTGTSADVMGTFGKTVYGKTGTADYIPETGPQAGSDEAYAWYDCYVPASETSRPIEITVWVEDGGYGDTSAAPVAREMLSQWFYGHPGAFAVSTSPSH